MDKNYDEKYHEILNSGELYDCTDSELFEYQHTLVEKMNEYNRVPDTKEGRERRTQILKEILGTYSEGGLYRTSCSFQLGVTSRPFGKECLYEFELRFSR